jgi:selenocysteine lyase/cysteine desulfurase
MLSRRGWLAGGALAPLALGNVREQFPIVRDEVCLNNAHWHPMSAGARDAVQRYLEFKSRGFGKDAALGMRLQKQVKEDFAAMVGVKASELAFVPSTMAGENLVVQGLAFAAGANVVTDALHFEPSRELYAALEKRSGVAVRMAPEKEGRIELRELERLIDRKTKLVAISAVSMRNGFQHDLKNVCSMAHAAGALVYVDMIQAAGAVPLDLREADVDFAACASYKWLMGDMGVGFLYVKESLQGTALQRPVVGYRQQGQSGAGALVEVGTVANATIAALSYSMPFLRQYGVDRIQAQRQPLLRKIQTEMPRLGFTPMTPAESTSPIVSFARKNALALRDRLLAAKVNIELYEDRVRVSPSVYNSLGDVERLLEALA